MQLENGIKYKEFDQNPKETTIVFKKPLGLIVTAQ